MACYWLPFTVPVERLPALGRIVTGYSPVERLLALVRLRGGKKADTRPTFALNGQKCIRLRSARFPVKNTTICDLRTADF